MTSVLHTGTVAVPDWVAPAHSVGQQFLAEQK